MSQYHLYQQNKLKRSNPQIPPLTNPSEQFIDVVTGQLSIIINAHQQLRKQINDLVKDQKQEVQQKHNWYQDKYFKLLRQSNMQQRQKYALIEQNQRNKHEILFLKNQIAELRTDLQKNNIYNHPQRLKVKNIKNIMEEQIMKLSQQIYNHNLQHQKKILQKDKQILSLKVSIQADLIAQVDMLAKQNQKLLLQNKELRVKEGFKENSGQNWAGTNLQQKERIIVQKLKQLKDERTQQLLQYLHSLRFNITNIRQKQRVKQAYNQIRMLQLQVQNEYIRISEKTLLNKINLYEQEIRQLQKLEGQNIEINRELINRLRNPHPKQQQNQPNIQASKDTEAMLQERLQQKLQAVKKQWSLKQLKWKETTGILEYKYGNLQKKFKQKSDRVEQLQSQNLKLKVDKNDLQQQLQAQLQRKQDKILKDIKYESFSNPQQQIYYLKNRLKQVQNQLTDQKAENNNLNIGIKVLEERINNLQNSQKVLERKNSNLSKQKERLKLELGCIKQQIISIKQKYVYTKSQYEQLLGKLKMQIQNNLQKNTRNNKFKQKQINSLNLNNKNSFNEIKQVQNKEKKNSNNSPTDFQQQLAIIYEASQTGHESLFHSNQYQLYNQPKLQQKIQYIPVTSLSESDQLCYPQPFFLSPNQDQQLNHISPIPDVSSLNDNLSSRQSSSVARSVYPPEIPNQYPIASSHPINNYPQSQTVSLNYRPVTYIQEKVNSPINFRYLDGKRQGCVVTPGEIRSPTILNTNITFNNYGSQHSIGSGSQTRHSLMSSQISTKTTKKGYYTQYTR